MKNKVVYILGAPFLKRSMIFNSYWDGLGWVNEQIERPTEDQDTFELWEIAELLGGG